MGLKVATQSKDVPHYIVNTVEHKSTYQSQNYLNFRVIDIWSTAMYIHVYVVISALVAGLALLHVRLLGSLCST